jgi:integrase
MARAWVHDRMKDAAYRKQVAAAKKAKRKPPWRWQVRWLDPEGKRQTELREKRAEADDYAGEIAASLVQGTYRDPRAGKAKLSIVAESWVQAKSPSWKPSTLRIYRNALDNYILPRFGQVAIGAVAYEDVATWLSSIYNTPGVSRSQLRKVGAPQVRMIYRVLSGVLRWGVKTGRIHANPITALDTLPAAGRAKRGYLDYVQIETLADAMGALETAYGRPRPGCDRYRVLVLVMGYCGLRIGEALALRKGAVDVEAMELDVCEAFSDGDGDALVVGLPKGDKMRVVGIPPSLVAELIPLLDGLDDEDLLFPGRGGPLRPRNFRRRLWAEAVEKAGVPESTTPHTLRHSFASLSVAAGCDVKTLQAAMGHASASITLDVYADLFPARVAEVAAALGRARDLALAA